MSIILLILAAGVPYYLILEKNKKLNSEKIFLISSFLVLCAIVISSFVTGTYSSLLVIISLLSAIFSIYKATKTTNFYKFGYYLLFINAPFFMLFIREQGVLYTLSLLITLGGVYSIAKHYDKYYGSANYHGISGTTLATPYVGAFLTVYLITLALYPPFPNALFLLSSMIKEEPTLLWYIVVVIVFLGNFMVAMRVMPRTVFGTPNTNLHYVDLTSKEKIIHFIIIILLLILSIIGFKGAIA
nr:DAC T subunit [synthetic construct]UAX26250.1 DAC T subunit [synthetic construct]